MRVDLVERMSEVVVSGYTKIETGTMLLCKRTLMRYFWGKVTPASQGIDNRV